ncbi:MAG: toxin-antitoxin system YwqK family antitoxin [Flavobacterium sp.]
MKYLVIILFFTCSLFAQNNNQLDANGKKQGVWKGTYEQSKRPRYEGTFEHGKEVGMFKFFDDTSVGTLIATREFNSKDNSCYSVFYNQKGNKVSEGKLVNKLYVGEWKYYHEDSPLVMTSENYSNGKLNGLRKVTYPSGKIAEEAYYKNGKKDGSYKKYTESGIVLEESLYKNGEFEGLAIFRSPDNVVVAKGIFVKGKKEGIWEFNTNGKITKENMTTKKVRKFVKKEITREEE